MMRNQIVALTLLTVASAAFAAGNAGPWRAVFDRAHTEYKWPLKELDTEAGGGLDALRVSGA